ncbi:MAG: ABC transporter ATP-binding protein, partial [Nitrososphaerales archaeon]
MSRLLPKKTDEDGIVLKTINLRKDYATGKEVYSALKGVSLTVKRGELVSVVGPSGSGKSTLLNLLGALDRPTSGKVYIDGVDIYRLNDKELAELRNRKIGFVFQAFNLIPRLTALD